MSDDFCVVRNTQPTAEQWGAYQAAWGWFNDRLFGGELAPCILNFSRKSKRNLGFFAPDRWEKDAASVPEISLNPDHLHRPLRETMSTLAHVMVHQWQYHFGSPDIRPDFQRSPCRLDSGHPTSTSSATIARTVSGTEPKAAIIESRGDPLEYDEEN